jgi:hypothetical protein
MRWIIAVSMMALLFGSMPATAACRANVNFGLNYDEQSNPGPVVTAAMSKIRGTHAGMVRIWVFWKAMELSPGQLDPAALSRLDQRVDGARAAGLTPLLWFAGIPDWANNSVGCNFWGTNGGCSGNCSAPPANADSFKNFVSKIASRYATRVDFYEIWNEPDCRSFWDGSMAQLHSLIIQPGVKEIRRVDPTSTILSPALVSSQAKFQNMLSLSCSQFDFVAIHSYDGSAAGMKQAVNFKWTPWMNNTSCRRKFWVTEFGIDSATSSLQFQADEYAKAASFFRNASVKASRLIYYRLEDAAKKWGLTTSQTDFPYFLDKPSYGRVRDTIPETCSGSASKSASESAFLSTIPADFDGNGISDTVLYSGGAWHKFSPGDYLGGVWTGGEAGCIPAPADYDGDGKTDFSLYCNGAWHFYEESGKYAGGIWTGGQPGAVPVPADYDGDGRADVVLYDAGVWHFYDHDSGAYQRGLWTGPGPGSVPVPGDYDGDGRANLSVYHNGAWHFFNDDGSYLKGIWTGGVAGDVPVPGDYDGDGIEEPVVFRGGAWLFFDYVTGANTHGVWTGANPPFLPAPLDIDGDGRLDFTIYEASGAWHFYDADGSYLYGVWTGVGSGQPISRRQLIQ